MRDARIINQYIQAVQSVKQPIHSLRIAHIALENVTGNAVFFFQASGKLLQLIQ